MTPDDISPDAVADLDRRHVWHPFTPMRQWEASDPVVIERGEGVWLIDTRGRRYIDGISSLWVNVHGHRHEAIDEAVKDQVDRLAHSTLLGLANVPSARLAARLAEIAPGDLTRVFYSDNGSTATEVALKMAFQYFRMADSDEARQRDRFFRFTNAYHGDTIGSVSVGGIDLFHRTFHKLTFETECVTAPHCYRCPFGREKATCSRECFDALDEAFDRTGSRCAAAIVEPLMQGAAGMILQPEGYLAHLERLCRRDGVLLIVDEVATGFGRTGRLFACEHENVAPDLLALAKGVTGGYLPLAATMTTAAVYEGFHHDRPAQGTFFHGHTYTGNPLACAAALANLDLFAQERTLERLAPRIETLTRLLAPLADRPHVGDIRQLGFMVGIELVADKPDKTPYPGAERRGAQVTVEARKRGAIIRPLGDVVVLMPPLCISETELTDLVEIVKASIIAVTEA